MKNALIFILCLFTINLWAQDIDQKPFYLPNTDIDVKSYSLDLKIEAISDQKPLPAELIIRLVALTNKDSIKLHATKGSIEVLEAKVNGLSVTTTFVNDYTLEISSPVVMGEEIEIDLSYLITTKQLQGVKRGLFFDNGVISVEDWPYYTRTWIPSNDSPNDPAAFEVKTTVPTGIEVMSNGLLVGQTSNSYHWKISNDITTYGINIVIGDYQEKSTTICVNLSFVNNTIDQCENPDLVLPLHLFLPSTFDEATVLKGWKQVLDSAGAVSFFSSIMGKYDFEKVAFVHALQSFRMEYPTLITKLGANIHELAHHWFGNSVLIQHWGDLWISEGFTTYLDGLYKEVYQGSSQDRWMKVPDGAFYYPEQTDPYAIFDAKPYQTGGAAVHAIRVLVRNHCGIARDTNEDREIVYAVLRSVYQAYKDKHLGTQELVSFLRKTLHETITTKTRCVLTEENSQVLLKEWSDTWIKF